MFSTKTLSEGNRENKILTGKGTCKSGARGLTVCCLLKARFSVETWWQGGKRDGKEQEKKRYRGLFVSF